MLSEHFPSEPSHAPVAFYPAYGPKPDLPLYLPRAAHPSGPPPLLASKREGPEAHMLPFYPTPYPPPVRSYELFIACIILIHRRNSDNGLSGRKERCHSITDVSYLQCCGKGTCLFAFFCQV